MVHIVDRVKHQEETMRQLSDDTKFLWIKATSWSAVGFIVTFLWLLASLMSNDHHYLGAAVFFAVGALFLFVKFVSSVWSEREEGRRKLVLAIGSVGFVMLITVGLGTLYYLNKNFKTAPVASGIEKSSFRPVPDKEITVDLPKIAATARATKDNRSSASPQQADLRCIFSGKSELIIQYKNPTSIKAETPRISYALMNLSHPYIYSPRSGDPPSAQPFPIPTEIAKDAWINPGDYGGYTSILQNFRSSVKSGDIIFGVVRIDCHTCQKTRSYYVYWKAGDGGWYSEGDSKHMELPRPTAQATPEDQLKGYLDNLVPAKKRQAMRDTYTID